MNKILRGVDEFARLVADKWRYYYSDNLLESLNAARLPLYCFIKDSFHSKEVYSYRDCWYPMLGVDVSYLCIRLQHIVSGSRRFTCLYLEFYNKDKRYQYTYTVRINRNTIGDVPITHKPYFKALHNYLRTRR